MTAQSTMQTQNQLHHISEAEWEMLMMTSQDADKIAEFSLQDMTLNLLQNKLSAETLHNLNNELTQVRHQWDELLKQQKLQQIQEKVCILREIYLKNQVLSSDILLIRTSILQQTFSYSVFTTSKWSAAEVSASQSSKWRVWLKKLSLYHEKTIKKHLNWIRDAYTVFCFSSENFSTEKNKVLYMMQYLADESKNT